MNPITQYLSTIGRAGGKAGRGKTKARSKAQCRKAALKMWELRRQRIKEATK